MQVDEKGWRVVSGIHPPNMWQQMSPRLHQDASFNPMQLTAVIKYHLVAENTQNQMMLSRRNKTNCRLNF